MKKIPTVNFKIQVFGTELDSWWRLKLCLLRRVLKIVSPCRAICYKRYQKQVRRQTPSRPPCAVIRDRHHVIENVPEVTMVTGTIQGIIEDNFLCNSFFLHSDYLRILIQVQCSKERRCNQGWIFAIISL